MQCDKCNCQFSLSNSEVANHDKFAVLVGNETFPVPLPKYCPDCSNQIRLSWINCYALYNRPCNNCNRDVISAYKETAPYKVYCNACYLHRENISLDYSLEKDFFEQFNSLLHEQPLLALNNDNNDGSINCAYTNYCGRSKNCYFIFASVENEDCYYGYSTQESKNSADTSYCVNVELCYETINCHGCYHSFYLVGCRLATDCYFSYDLNNCNHCLFSSGLRNKEYYIFNQPYTKETYEKYFAEHFQTASWKSWQKLVHQFNVWYQTVIRKNVSNRHVENCVGNDMQYCKNTSGFFMYKGIDSRNLMSANTCTNVSDLYKGSLSELCYQSIHLRQCYQTIASAFCAMSTNVMYSMYCHNCKNIFGCIGLQDKEYCILNKQYSKEAYEQLVPKIIKHLESINSWGDFFTNTLSPFDYEETIANDIFPQKTKLLSDTFDTTTSLPDSSLDTSANDIKEAIICNQCTKKFRHTEQELSLYQNLKVPLPRACYWCRHQSRNRRRPNLRLYQSTCKNCNAQMVTHYPPQDENVVYCEDCYLKHAIIN